MDLQYKIGLWHWLLTYYTKFHARMYILQPITRDAEKIKYKNNLGDVDKAVSRSMVWVPVVIHTHTNR